MLLHMSHKKLQINLKRAYEDKSKQDGYRVLVDRVWPRGRSKETLALDQWARELAPSDKLRKWFDHDVQRWEEFRQRYGDELKDEEKQEQMRQLLADANGQILTLVYGAKDTEHNQAVVLRDVLLRLSTETRS